MQVQRQKSLPDLGVNKIFFPMCEGKNLPVLRSTTCSTLVFLEGEVPTFCSRLKILCTSLFPPDLHLTVSLCTATSQRQGLVCCVSALTSSARWKFVKRCQENLLWRRWNWKEWEKWPRWDYFAFTQTGNLCRQSKHIYSAGNKGSLVPLIDCCQSCIQFMKLLASG